MDMRKHLRKWLNERALRDEFAGVYEGQIDDVFEQEIRNRFTADREIQPVIRFVDGWSLIPNVTQKRSLCAMYGPETDEWIGRRLEVYLHKIERADASTGLVKVRFEKRVRSPISELSRAVV
jgi:hypothetical protein